MTKLEKRHLDIWMCNTCEHLSIDSTEHFQLTKHNSHTKVGDVILILPEVIK